MVGWKDMEDEKADITHSIHGTDFLPTFTLKNDAVM